MATWFGLPEVISAFERVSVQADATSRSIVVKGAAIVEKEAKANFSGAHKKGEPHIGGPGSPPNIVTGTLRRSIRHSPVARGGFGEYVSKVGPTVIYGRRVELGGTAAGWRGRSFTTHPHPYFEPAVAKARAQFEALVAAEWAAFLKA